MAIPRVTQILFFLCIIINSNRVHSTASTELSWEDVEQFPNITTIIKQTRRVRRTVAFQPGSRIMVREKLFDDIKNNSEKKNQFRVNTKDNIIKNNQIFAHGFGFRANIDVTQPNVPSFLPSEQELHRNRKRRSLTRHEVYETLEELINQLSIEFPIFFKFHTLQHHDDINRHGFDGRSCIMKMICDATEIGKSDGMLLKIFKLIFT